MNFTFPAVEKRRHFRHRREAPSPLLPTQPQITLPNPPRPPNQPPYDSPNTTTDTQNSTINLWVLFLVPAGRYPPIVTSAMAFPPRRRTSASPAEAENDAGRPTATSINAQRPWASITVAAVRQKCVRQRHMGGVVGGCGAGGAMV